MIILPILTTSLIRFSLKCLENLLLFSHFFRVEFVCVPVSLLGLISVFTLGRHFWFFFVLSEAVQFISFLDTKNLYGAWGQDKIREVSTSLTTAIHELITVLNAIVQYISSLELVT